jgi:hypothetical protein
MVNSQKPIVDTLDRLQMRTDKMAFIGKYKLARLAELKQAILHKALAGELTSRSAKVLREAAE